MFLPKRRKPEKHKTGPQIRSPSHLAWLRGFECSVAGKGDPECGGKIEAAHVRTGTDGGTSLKPSDCHAIPLCGIHHARQHSIGEASFEKQYGIDMKAIARMFWSRSPHRERFARGQHD